MVRLIRPAEWHDGRAYFHVAHALREHTNMKWWLHTYTTLKVGTVMGVSARVRELEAAYRVMSLRTRPTPELIAKW